MKQKLLIESWKHEQEQPFSGWDFSYLRDKMREDEPDWSYELRAPELLDRSGSALDLDTGGGERFLALRGHWPAKVAASEGYAPNFKLASERLAPLGVKVIQASLTDVGPLPFADAEFELILNRHGTFNPAEIARVLPPGGTFFTQQVHGLFASDLLAIFGARPQWPDSTPEKYLPLLKAAGLEIIEAREWSGQLSFTEVGAIVYYLKAVPWLVPDFSVEKHLEALLTLQQRLENTGELTFCSRKYLIEARKPKVH